MALSNEKALGELIDQISLTYIDYGTKNTQGKINSRDECIILVNKAKTKIEDLKIEIINLDKDTKNATKKQIDQVNDLIMYSQLPNLSFDNLRQIITELKAVYNAIPETVNVIHNVEDEIIFDEIDF